MKIIVGLSLVVLSVSACKTRANNEASTEGFETRAVFDKPITSCFTNGTLNIKVTMKKVSENTPVVLNYMDFSTNKPKEYEVKGAYLMNISSAALPPSTKRTGVIEQSFSPDNEYLLVELLPNNTGTVTMLPVRIDGYIGDKHASDKDTFEVKVDNQTYTVANGWSVRRNVKTFRTATITANGFLPNFGTFVEKDKITYGGMNVSSIACPK